MGKGLLDPRALIGLFVALLIAFAILPSLFADITTFAALAILGSFGGGTSLPLIVGTVLLAALVLAVVDMAMGGRATGAIRRRMRRRRF